MCPEQWDVLCCLQPGLVLKAKGLRREELSQKSASILSLLPLSPPHLNWPLLYLLMSLQVTQCPLAYSHVLDVLCILQRQRSHLLPNDLPFAVCFIQRVLENLHLGLLGFQGLVGLWVAESQKVTPPGSVSRSESNNCGGLLGWNVGSSLK